MNLHEIPSAVPFRRPIDPERTCPPAVRLDDESARFERLIRQADQAVEAWARLENRWGERLEELLADWIDLVRVMMPGPPRRSALRAAHELIDSLADIDMGHSIYADYLRAAAVCIVRRDTEQ